MDDAEKIKQRYELLKMARELLNEDYINRRAEDHNKWVAENEALWRTARRNLPYPPFAKYPTDEEIVRAASNLYDFVYGKEKSSDVNQNSDTQVTENAPAPPPKIIPEGDFVFPREVDKNLESEKLPEVIDEDHAATTEDIPGERASSPLQDIKDLVSSNRLLPGWVRRSK